MVLEYIIGPRGAEKKPYQMIFIGMLYVVAALLISFWIFPDNVDLVAVFLCTFASIPVIYDALRIQEKEGVEIEDEVSILRQHGRAISFFVCLFIGFVIGYAIFYVSMPFSIVQKAFVIQTQTITAVNGNATGGIASYWNAFTTIFVNNFKVMLFCLLFSFVYGMGAIFILVWNASVLGAATGNFIRTNLQHYTSVLGMSAPAAYLKAYALGLFRYSIHGIPEMAAYFVAGLAGSIISIAVIRHDLATKNFEKIMMDSSDLIVISIIILFIAAILEIFITPVLF
ncbi:MAG: stage II sporulation protein M [Candidatus Woesearchaeota archaeon]|nr:stage II sporulation protein M [Candidatus Woesearchaeota archaeon]